MNRTNSEAIMLVNTPERGQRRLNDIDREARAQARDKLAQTEVKERQNDNFVQVYPKGFSRIRWLIDQYPVAAKIYTFLAEHIDGQCGAVVVSQEILAQEMGVHERTIRRASAFLEECGALVRIKVGGTVYAYALNPKEVWKTWDSKKDLAAFNTKTLASKRHNGQVRKRLKVMVGEPELPGLDDEPGFDPDTGEVLE